VEQHPGTGQAVTLCALTGARAVSARVRRAPACARQPCRHGSRSGGREPGAALARAGMPLRSRRGHACATASLHAEEQGGLPALLPWRWSGRSRRRPVYAAPWLRVPGAAPPPSLALPGAHAPCRALVKRTVGGSRYVSRPPREPAAVSRPSRSDGRQSRPTGVGQTPCGWTCAQPSRQNTLPEDDDGRPNTAEKKLEHPL
jgi:hypothetical protein